MTASIQRRSRGFTLLEIMIVVSVVVILSWLAMLVIGRVRDHAARSMLQNNLRQIYQAKEYYHAETGSTQPSSIIVLAREGYVSASFRDRLLTGHSFEGNLGWVYDKAYQVNQPVRAYKGSPANPTEVIYYPGPSTSAPATNAPAVTTTTVTPTVPTPVVTTPAVTTPPTTTTPVTTVAGTNPPVTNPATTGTPQAGTSSSSGSTPPHSSGHGPGNSDFGHSHNPGHGPKH